MANGGSLTARVCVTKWLGVYKLSQHCYLMLAAVKVMLTL